MVAQLRLMGKYIISINKKEIGTGWSRKYSLSFIGGVMKKNLQFIT
jgi:hypothetical protein